MLPIGDLVTHDGLSHNQEVFGYPILQGIVKKVVNKSPHTHVQVFWLDAWTTMALPLEYE